MTEPFPTFKKVLAHPRASAHYEKQLQKFNTEHDEHGRFGAGSGSSPTAATKPAAAAKVPTAADTIKKVSKIVAKLNSQANRMRREGDTPFFENVVHMNVNGKIRDVTYQGFFDHAEPEKDGTVVQVWYQQEGGGKTYTNFRPDQMSEASLS